MDSPFNSPSQPVIPDLSRTRLRVRVIAGVRSTFRQLAQRPLSLIGFGIMIVFALMAIFAPLIAPYEYDAIIRGAARLPPGAPHWFGTDSLGRDVFSRVIFGSREIIVIPLITSLLSVCFGAAIGMLIGYTGGIIDSVISRILDSLLAIPALLLALVMLGTIGSSSVGIIIVIVLLYTPIVARVVRSATLSLRNSSYVEAAKLRGEGTGYILFRELLPAVLPALIVEGALRFSYAIFLTASLGFLGLGVQPPSPDWGRMVNEARNTYTVTPWALWYPAAAIAILVVGVNLFSDGLRRIFRYEGHLS
jgi:peptide/nickel transport system permease protein